MQRNDGVIRRLQPDVFAVLTMMAGLDLPLIETLSADQARAFSDAMAQSRPPGPEVARSPTACCRCRRRPRLPPLPAGEPRPHPLVAYFHGGGGCSATRSPTTRCAAICACAPTPSSCRSTTATPRRTASRRRPKTASPPCSGSPPTPRARRRGRPAGRGRLERRRQHRRRHLPAGPGCRRARHRRPGPAHAGDRLRLGRPSTSRTPRATSSHGDHGVVLDHYADQPIGRIRWRRHFAPPICRVSRRHSS